LLPYKPRSDLLEGAKVNARLGPGGLIALVLSAGPGCSLLVVDGPPPVEVRHETDFVCTTSRAVPLADVVAALAIGIHEAGDVGNGDRKWTGLALSPEHHFLMSAGLFMAFALSAGIGSTRVEACREASAQRDRGRQAQQPTASAAPP
jgi:hypothetical protein